MSVVKVTNALTSLKEMALYRKNFPIAFRISADLAASHTSFGADNVVWVVPVSKPNDSHVVVIAVSYLGNLMSSRRLFDL